MSVAKAVVGRPVLWLVIFSLVAISSIFLISNIAVDMYPEIERPFLIISTTYPGADPETVEQNVTSIIERALANVGDIKKMTSVSRSQSSVITIEFEYGTDMEIKTNRARENIDRVRNALPDNVGSPVFLRMGPDDSAVMRIAVRGISGSGLTQNDLRAFAINELEDRFRQIENVASVSIDGGLDPIVQVALSQNRLEAYGLTISEISRSLASQNVNLGAGFIEDGLVEYSLRTTGEFSSLAEVANTVVAQSGGADIRLLDIGEVTFGFQEERSAVYVNGEPGVYLSVNKQQGANTVRLVDQVYRQLELIERILPSHINLEVILDASVQTRAMINELVSSIIMGLILAMLILFFFFRNTRGSIIVGLSIPVSFAATLLVMSLSNITVNMMTLAGLILGMGMTVDCSIVVIENIIAYREKGEKKKIAAILAGEEVMSSLIAATISTVCVFVPIILFKNQLGFIGLMFQDLVYTVVISVVVSLFTGICLVPVLASKWLPIYSRTQKPLSNSLVRYIDERVAKSIIAFTNAYQWVLSKALKHKLVTILLVISALGGSILAFGKLDTIIMPRLNSDTLVISIEMPLGTRYDDTKAVALEIQEFAIANINGIKNIITNIGRSGGGAMAGTGTNIASILVVIDLDDPNADSNMEARNKLRLHSMNFPNAAIRFGSSGPGGMMGGSDIDIVLRIDDITEGLATAETIKQVLETLVPEVQDVSVDMREGLPQINVNIDRERVYNMGLSVTSIAVEIAASMNGVTSTTLRQSGGEYNVVLQLAKEDRYELPDLGRIFVRSSRGILFPVSNFASFDKSQGPVTINRESQVRTIHITASVREGYSVRQVETKISELLDELGINVIYAGLMQETQNMMQTFILVIGLALLLIFGVMAAQYESFRDPFINFCTIPLVMIGVVFIHIITNQPISAFSMIGIVLLAGLVTNNGILLVNYTNQLVRKGMSVHEACIKAGAIRFRPVLMTALTTMLALAPMAFFPGTSSAITSPIGLAVFGGLTSATVITLVFIPVLYSIFHSKVKEQNDED